MHKSKERLKHKSASTIRFFNSAQHFFGGRGNANEVNSLQKKTPPLHGALAVGNGDTQHFLSEGALKALNILEALPALRWSVQEINHSRVQHAT